MNRAYSILEIRSVSDDLRVLEGVATTPTPDRMGDIIEPLGVKFKNPMPLLWQHKSDKPVGLVRFDKPTEKGITFRAELARVEEPGTLKDRVDEAWQSVKHKLVRAVSIGFRPIEYSFMDDGGIHFLESEVMELSLVTIPANVDAVISAVKSIDAEQRAASGRKLDDDDRPKPPGASGKTSTKVVKAEEATPMKKTIAEQIAGFEATRAAKAARMQEIMDAAAEKGETLDEAGQQEYDGLSADLKSVDAHLVRLNEMQSLNLTKAVEAKGSDPAEASRSRTPIAAQRIQVLPKKLEPGIGFTRFVIALARAKGNIMQAHEIFKSNERWMSETPDVEHCLKAAVAAGTTTGSTWAEPLVQYQNLASEFIEYTRPLTIIGRIQGLRRVPFKVKLPRQTGAASVGWVGEGKVKKVSALAFDSLTLDIAKIAGIVVLTDELVRHSSPSAELLVRDDLAKGIVQFQDEQFVDPTKAADDVSPASITNGVTPVVATGTSAAALRTDVRSLIQKFLDADLGLGDAVWLMSQSRALAISLMTNDLGNPDFPGISMNGGTFLTIPVIASESVPATGGSPTDGDNMILAKAGDILLADEGGVEIDASREATLQMDDAPDSPSSGTTNLLSLWQHNMMGIRAEREINWKKRRSASVQYITSAKYVDA